jgi:hypothetical protein
MTDMQAALGLSQLELFDEALAERRRQAERYNAAFRNHPYVTVPYECETLMLALFPGLADQQRNYVIERLCAPRGGTRGMIPTALLLLGASGFARETLELVRAVNDESPRRC